MQADSEVTSLAASTPPRSPRRPIYYVMSPSHNDPGEKTVSLGSSPATSPYHHHHHRYASSPVHHHYHSRESSATRFSASIKNTSTTTCSGPWKKLSHYEHRKLEGEEGDGDLEEEEEEEEEETKLDPRCYVLCFFLGFVLLFSLFSLILWAASKAYRPHFHIKRMVFDSFNIQAGIDVTGVPTKMLSVNSTLKLSYRNPATFFGVHVTSSPLDLYYYDLKIASGHMNEFYQSRKSGKVVTVAVGGSLVPLYGGGSTVSSRADGEAAAEMPVTLTFVVRSRAYILGKLVRSKFYTRVRCSFLFRERRIGRPVDVRTSCRYRH